MDPEALQQTLAQAGLAAVGVAFLAGFFFSFNPVAVASIPVALAYVTKAREPRQAVVFGAMFIVGMLLAHVVLGLIAGFGGRWVEGLVGRYWGAVLGPLLILLGLLWPGWLRVPLPAVAFRARRPSGPFGALLLGVPFSIAVCPVCTPALMVMLGVTIGAGSAIFGAVLLLAFALGRAVPIALGGWALGWVKQLKGAHVVFDIVGGVTLIASGLYLLNAYFFWIPSLAG
jgi:cytochrome c-type biogenesis protein